MKPAPFAYHAPETLDEALELVDTLDNARVLAGGQSLVPMLNLRLAQPDHDRSRAHSRSRRPR
jgi:carbon-monoxide dehydrogenase medium subunit